MNTITYNLLNKINEPRNINEFYLNSLYEFYEKSSKVLNYEINIKMDDFKKIFIIIHDILRFKISEEEFKIASENYLKLIIADASEGYNVDLKWFIKYIWYLDASISIKPYSEKYKDCIMFLQQKLINEFSIEEKHKEKIKRKIYTRSMI